MLTPRLVKQIHPGIRESRNDGGWSQGQFSALGDLLFFLVYDGLGDVIELWRSDGTARGTFKLAHDTIGFLGDILVSEGSVFFNTHAGLWISDGSANGTRLLIPTPEDANIFLSSIVRLGNSLIGVSRGAPHYGFWEVDKTKGLISQRISSRTAEHGSVVAIGNRFFFAGRDNIFGPNVNLELWRSDGTESGTVKVADIWPGDRTEESSAPHGLTVLGETLLFTANDGIHGFELWRSDGTAAGTAMVADINPGNLGSVSFPLGQQPVVKGSIYFSATDGLSGYELWKSDGTSAGTKRVADINPGSNGSGPRELTVVEDTLYFTALSQGEYELWKSDGTEKGTTRIFSPGPGIGIPKYLTAVGNLIFFSTTGSLETGRELWKSDGTTAGTHLVADILPGSKGSEPRDLKLVGKTLFFSAKSDDNSGRQLWALDLADISNPASQVSIYAIERLNQANLNSDGNEGSRHTFRIKRSGNTALAGSVRFSTSNGTATSGVDFLPFSRDIQFLAGEDKKDVYVDSRKDSLNEGTERFNVAITKINARDTIAKASTYGEIFNLPPASTYSIERRSSDGKEGHRHTFLIKREGDLSRPGQVRVSTSSNSATSGVDFNAYSAVRNFAINQDEQIVYVDSRSDSLKEGTERFNISLSIVRSQDKLNVATTFGQIFDVPPPSTYSIETLNTVDRKSDGLEGSRHYFRVKRSGNSAVSGSIRFSTSSGSAISNNDFLPYSTTIVFRPGEIEKYVYVDSIVDSLNEGTENLKASISRISPQDILGSSSVVGVIRNRIINYNGVDKDGFPFVMKGVKSDPNWSVRFRLKDNRINPVLPTYVYIHGWQDSSNSPNSNLILSALSAAGANVINVDWRELASVKKGLRPLEAATVTRQVGECLADFLIKSSIDPASTTIIGHSLGSFVAASAANKFRLRTGKRIKELVALDTANNPLGPYDIDARNSQDDAPLFFFNDLALSTSSYTASDLVGGLPSSAGDNARAATAQNAYLVQYARSSNLPGLGDEQATAFHNGVIGVYADLFKKKLLHPSNTGLNTADRFDASGRLTSLPSPLNFDGVVVAATPWSWKDNGFKQDVILSAPKAIGWTDRYASPEIHGSEVNDIIFFDQFLEAHDGSTLFGKGGNDSLIANQTDGNGVDRLIGGTGSDQFWFGYRRYGKTILPYLDKDDKTTFGGTAYAVVMDFNSSQDRLNFGWARNEISVRMGSSIHTSFSSLPGVGFFANNDLVVYVPGLMLGSVQNLIRDNRIAFNQMAILDSSLIA